MAVPATTALRWADDEVAVKVAVSGRSLAVAAAAAVVVEQQQVGG